MVREAQRDLELGRLALAVYDLMRDWLDFVEWREVKLAELEKQFRRSRPQVLGALKQLVDRGYIARGERAYSRGPYQYRMVYSRGRDKSLSAAGGRRSSDYGMVSQGVEW